MKPTEIKLFDSLETLTYKVKQEFKNKGFIIPARDSKGNVIIGNYKVVRKNGFYSVVNKDDSIILDYLNLAETAVVIANDLSLGRVIDQDLLRNDQWYGFKSFDEQSCRRMAKIAMKKQDYDKAEYTLERAVEAAKRKLGFKKPIQLRFDKLRKLI